MLFSLPDKSGTLSGVLSLLAEHKITMRKLESRPLRGQCWKYVFYTDVDCDLTAPQYEALLRTLAAACAARQDDCFLATGDRDSLQLVSETTTVLLATSAMGRSKTETMDLDAIHEKYGIEPKQLIEVKRLMGDTSDNIQGV